ncbi:MAG: hypothetical protein KDB00_29465, partial [Planctomycetales bacterium]|nr:hypothetical protein [Planctomycetales bacterium]
SRSGTIEIAQVENFEWRQPVYNLEIHTEHVYEIGNAGILVHNTGGDGCPVNAPRDGIDYPLKRPDGVSDADWQKKLDALNQGAAEGQAKVVHKPVRDGKAQRQARQLGQIEAGHDADHGLDLQFGGDDTIDEIISTQSRVNRSVGAQGRGRLQHPDGTPIKRFTEE